MELDKLHVRDNVKLAEVNIKMFLYQDSIPMFEIWLCLSSDVKAKKMLWFFFMSVQRNKEQQNKEQQNKEQQNKEQQNKEVCDSQNWCSASVFLIFLLCAQPYTTVGFMWHFHVFEIFLFGIAV